MPGPYAIRVRTPDGWQEIALVGPQGPPGTPPLRVTALPGSPANGQEVIYVADELAGVLWHLRYNAGSVSPYKWEFVGGSGLYDELMGDETFASFGPNAWGGVNANDPQVTVPLAGVYRVLNSARLLLGGAGHCHIGVQVGATEPIVGTNSMGGSPAGAGSNAPITQHREITATVANTLLRQRYWHNAAAATNLSRASASLQATPVRVG